VCYFFWFFVNSWGNPKNEIKIFNKRQKLRTALSKLNPQDLRLIELVFGICPDCLKSKEKLTIRETSLRVGLTATGAEKKIKKILIQ